MAKPKLRKMLGSAKHPLVIKLMRIIETQSQDTLCRWALDYVQAHYFPILNQKGCCDSRFIQAAQTVENLLHKRISLKEGKPFFKQAAAAAREIDQDPAAQAAAKAISVACSIAQTPTNALGFTFYGAAAYAYDCAGFEASRQVYEQLATEEFQTLLDALNLIAVLHEPNPVKINWNC